MRASVQDRYGGPEVVRVVDVDDPVPADDELLVRVRRTTVNRTDCAYRSASPPFIRFVSGLRRPKVATWGTELAGVVERVGPAVNRFAAGDRVFAYVEDTFGAHAELAVVGQDASVARIPDGIDDDHAAAATEGSHYALAFLRVAGVEAGMDVMVYGATGAIGSAAVQLAKEAGATVTAVCATPHLEVIAALGPDRVVDHTAGDIADDDQRYDVVMDAVGKRTFGTCRGLLRPKGCYVSSELGPWGQNLVLPLVTRVRGGQRVRFPYPKHDRAMIERFADLMARGAFTPLLDRTYPLDEIVTAYRYVETGQKVGSVLVDPGWGRSDA